MNLDELATKIEEGDRKRVAELNEAADRATFFGELLEVPARLLHRLRAEAYDRGRQSMKDEAIAAVDAAEASIVDSDGDAHVNRRGLRRAISAIPVRKEGNR